MKGDAVDDETLRRIWVFPVPPFSLSLSLFLVLALALSKDDYPHHRGIDPFLSPGGFFYSLDFSGWAARSGRRTSRSSEAASFK